MPSESWKYKTRPVEVGMAYGDDHGIWNTDYVDIPIYTPPDFIAITAIEAALRRARERHIDNVAHVWVYSIPDIEEDDHA